MIKTFLIDSTLAEYTSAEFAWLQSLLWEEGVFGDKDGTQGLAVSQNSPTGMSVLVSAGNALVELTKNSTTWKVVVMSNAQATVAVPANTSGANRIDAIIVRVDKDADPNALKNNIGTIELIQGDGVTALSDADIDTAVGNDGWIRLANITVSDSETAILTADIADTRTRVKSNQATRLNPDRIDFKVLAADPAGANLYEGLLWYNSTTHTLKYYDGSAVQPVLGDLQTDSGTAVSGSNKVIDQAAVDTAATASKVVRRIAAGQITVPASPSASTDAASKGFVEGLAPVYKHGVFSKTLSDSSTSQNIAHGLGKIPKYIRMTLFLDLSSGSNNITYGSVGTYDGSTTATVYFNPSGGDGTDTTYVVYYSDAGGAQRAAAAFDATNITLTWTKTSSPSGNTGYVMWEAFA